jgi:hypothetical protein
LAPRRIPATTTGGQLIPPSNYEVKGDELVFTRKLVQKASTIPVEQYNIVRTFFEKIRAAEQSPVVLARK